MPYSVLEASVVRLNAITCNGKTVLVDLPGTFSLNALRYRLAGF
jgi:hypothetical protein